MTDYSPAQSLDFSGLTAVIMGASRGIGLASAKVLAAYGARVVLCARSTSDIEREASKLQAQGREALAIECDVSDYDAVVLALSEVTRAHGGVDILVNCAGVIDPLATLAQSDPQEWARAVDINVKGTYYGMRAALPAMVERRSGTIVNISSGAVNSALVGWSHYCATKAAAAKLTAVAHKEVSESGVRVVGLSPGTVATDMMRKIKDSGINVVSNLDWSSHIPPEWAGEGVAFLCGPEGGAFAGTDFSIKTPEGRRRVGLSTARETSSS